MKLNIEQYFEGVDGICELLNGKKFDCIVALKRSGWIMGVILSNRFGYPLYSSTEIHSIPDKFKNILIVDDKICTGKSIQKIKNKLSKKDKNITTCCIFVQSDKEPDVFYRNINSIHKMFYEK